MWKVLHPSDLLSPPLLSLQDEALRRQPIRFPSKPLSITAHYVTSPPMTKPPSLRVVPPLVQHPTFVSPLSSPLLYDFMITTYDLIIAPYSHTLVIFFPSALLSSGCLHILSYSSIVPSVCLLYFADLRSHMFRDKEPSLYLRHTTVGTTPTSI